MVNQPHSRFKNSSEFAVFLREQLAAQPKCSVAVLPAGDLAWTEVDNGQLLVIGCWPEEPDNQCQWDIWDERETLVTLEQWADDPQFVIVPQIFEPKQLN